MVQLSRQPGQALEIQGHSQDRGEREFRLGDERQCVTVPEFKKKHT